jgi:lysine 2,3-aminomutase
MRAIQESTVYNLNLLKQAIGDFLLPISNSANLEVARERLFRMINNIQYDTYSGETTLFEGRVVRVRDSVRALRSIIKQRSDVLAGFSVMQALYDIAKDNPRPDLKEGFYAEMYHLFMGIRGKGPGVAPGDFYIDNDLEEKLL